MDPYDSEKAARVWQRVHSTPNSSPSAPGLSALLLQLRQLEAVYRALLRQTAAHGAVLRSLADRKHAQAACIRGLHILTAGSCPEPSIPHPKPEPISTALRRCCTIEMQLSSHFDLHSADPACGPVFSDFAAEQRQICRSLATLLGQLER